MGRRKKRRRAIHIGALILGAYLLFLGGGTLLVNLTEISRGNREGIVCARALMGAVFTCLGVYAVWDGVRDLLPRKRREPAPDLRFIFTGADGVRSSNVTAETIREQTGRISEEARHVSLQPVAPIPAAELGELVRLDYALMEDGMFLVAVFRKENLPQVRREPAESGEAAEALTALLGGKMPDFSGWESVQAVPRQPEPRQSQCLTLVRDSGRNDHEFFSERDMDLAVTGLADGTYRQAVVRIGPASVTASPGENGDIVLHLRVWADGAARAWRRRGTPAQARFWLVQFYDGSLFKSSGEGWEDTDPQ